MKIKVIKTDKEHKEALKAVEKLWEAKLGTPRGDRLELLAALVEDYEEKHFPIPAPDPIEAIKFRMEQEGMSQADLAPLMGGKNRVSEVLGGKRALTVGMIRNLCKKLHIPAEALIACR
jgi:HTH-type transcriptional regulator/antitoxin HigA